MSFADKVMHFNRSLRLDAALPAGISAMNPFSGAGSNAVLERAGAFYNRYYGDENKRWLILGINPGRHGGGITGVPFTDFKRMRECGIDTGCLSSHEPSSEFVYKMIHACGGIPAFYSQVYINSICPLGFIKEKNGKWVNYNYYDDKKLYAAVKPFIIQSIKQQLAFGIHTQECFCMGMENAVYLEALNMEHGFFDKITMLPHPRYIVQYKRRQMDEYIDGYVRKLGDRISTI